MLSSKFKSFLFLFLGIFMGIMGFWGYQKFQISIAGDTEKIVFKENEPYLINSSKPGKDKPKVDTVVIEKTVIKEVEKQSVENMDADSNRVESDFMTDQVAGEIVVRSDKLIGVKEIPLELVGKKEPEKEGKDLADSLLAEKLNIKPSPKIEKIKVEIWSSPIHFKGYKFSQNKLVTYGMEPDALIKVYQVEKAYFLKTPVTLFKLEITEEFKKWVIADQTDIDRARNGD